jgi:hypothetical protein
VNQVESGTSSSAFTFAASSGASAPTSRAAAGSASPGSTTVFARSSTVLA